MPIVARLVGGGDRDRLALWIVEAVHRRHIHEHDDAKEEDRYEDRTANDRHPDGNREEADTVIVVAELVVPDSEHLDLQ